MWKNHNEVADYAFFHVILSVMKVLNYFAQFAGSQSTSTMLSTLLDWHLKSLTHQLSDKPFLALNETFIFCIWLNFTWHIRWDTLIFTLRSTSNKKKRDQHCYFCQLCSRIEFFVNSDNNLFILHVSPVDEGWNALFAVLNFGVLKRIQTPHSLMNFILGFRSR